MGKGRVIKKLIAGTLEQTLESKLTEHLGYKKYSPNGEIPETGKTHKSLK